MTKGLKTILDQAESYFLSLDKADLKILKLYIEMAHAQGVIDYINKCEEKRGKN